MQRPSYGIETVHPAQLAMQNLAQTQVAKMEPFAGFAAFAGMWRGTGRAKSDKL
jgi:hypothetical protein